MNRQEVINEFGSDRYGELVFHYLHDHVLISAVGTANLSIDYSMFTEISFSEEQELFRIGTKNQCTVFLHKNGGISTMILDYNLGK